MKPLEIQLPNVWGLTPLEWARQSNRSEVALFIERRYQKLGLKIDRYGPPTHPPKLAHQTHQTHPPTLPPQAQRQQSFLRPSFPLPPPLGRRLPFHWHTDHHWH